MIMRIFEYAEAKVFNLILEKHEDRIRYFATRGNMEGVRETFNNVYRANPQCAKVLIEIAIRAAEQSRKSNVISAMGDMLISHFGNTRGAIRAYVRAGDREKIQRTVRNELEEFGLESAKKVIDYVHEALSDRKIINETEESLLNFYLY